jgi:SAM-dependent methyltransferase
LTDWRAIYVDNADIYQPVLEAGLSFAPAEAKGLDKVFRRFGLDHTKRRLKVLDVSCGIGRHSINLAKLGYEVVGFDFSPYFLRTARRTANQEGLGHDKVRFIEGDTARLWETLESQRETEFDAIICMDTSVVRPTLGEERALLRSMYSVARLGSILVIETANRDSFLKHRISLPFVQTLDGGRLQRHILATYDAKERHIKGEWRFYRKRENGDLKHLLTVDMNSNIHSEPDLRKLVEQSGWTFLKSYGSIQRLNRLDSDSFHIVMVVKRVD